MSLVFATTCISTCVIIAVHVCGHVCVLCACVYRLFVYIHEWLCLYMYASEYSHESLSKLVCGSAYLLIIPFLLFIKSSVNDEILIFKNEVRMEV